MPTRKRNFPKFLVDREGWAHGRFEPKADMKEVIAAVEAACEPGGKDRKHQMNGG